MALLSCRGNNTVSLPVCRDLLVSPHTWCLLFHRAESDFISLRYLFQQLRQVAKSKFKCFYLRSLPLCSSPGGKRSQGRPKPKNALKLLHHPISFIRSFSTIARFSIFYQLRFKPKTFQWKTQILSVETCYMIKVGLVHWWSPPCPLMKPSILELSSLSYGVRIYKSESATSISLKCKNNITCLSLKTQCIHGKICRQDFSYADGRLLSWHRAVIVELSCAFPTVDFTCSS